jgi:hypothetical protein
MPRVLEGANLAGRSRAILFLKEGVVVLGGVERGVEIDEVNRRVFHIPAQDVEVVAVIELSHAGGL